MADGFWEIKEIQQAGADVILKVEGQKNLKPQAGQYFQAFAVGVPETLTTSLFITGFDGDFWGLTGNVPLVWSPGMILKWRGPLGRGFNLLPTHKKILLLPWQNSGLGLLPLVKKALDQMAEVVWCGGQSLSIFPESVEVLPLEMLNETWIWADYAAVECTAGQVGKVISFAGIPNESLILKKTEVLVHTSMPCGGQAECMACGVKTRRGWKTACKDGPVFPMEQLELSN